MTFKQWMRTPKACVMAVLLVYLLLASAWSHDSYGIAKAMMAVGICMAVDILLSGRSGKKSAFPDGAVITGLIIALILSTTTPVFVVAATAALAVLSKHFLVYNKKPIFNPAAIGLMLSIPLFHTGQSWWGAFGDLSPWAIALLLVGGYFIVNRVNKFPQVFAYLAVSFIALGLMGYLHLGDAADAFRPPFINATLFFALFMLTDPPTSPGKDRDQVIFGVVCAFVGVIFYAVFGGLMYLFVGLFAANVFRLWKARPSLRAARRPLS